MYACKVSLWLASGNSALKRVSSFRGGSMCLDCLCGALCLRLNICFPAGNSVYGKQRVPMREPPINLVCWVSKWASCGQKLCTDIAVFSLLEEWVLGDPSCEGGSPSKPARGFCQALPVCLPCDPALYPYCVPVLKLRYGYRCMPSCKGPKEWPLGVALGVSTASFKSSVLCKWAGTDSPSGSKNQA